MNPIKLSSIDVGQPPVLIGEIPYQDAQPFYISQLLLCRHSLKVLSALWALTQFNKQNEQTFFHFANYFALFQSLGEFSTILSRGRSLLASSHLCGGLFSYRWVCKTTQSVDLDKCFQLINGLVDQAGAIIARRNDMAKEFVQKQGATDLVTETDKEVEKLLMDVISKQFPDHKFICEEESSEAGALKKLTDAPTWIIDPVDGTMNFVHSFPHSCISVGLVVNKVIELGIVYNAMLKQRFTAQRGKGAFYNGKPMKVSGEKELSKALIISEFGKDRDPEKLKVVTDNFHKLSAQAHGLRVLGSTALNMCMVAMGGADAHYEFGAHAWDVCAGDIIVREAGGVVIDPAGGKFDMMSRRVLSAATPELAMALAEILTQYYPKPRDDA